MSNLTECPYCGADVEICHDDGFGCEEAQIYEQECPECEKTFVFTISYSIDYSPAKADCLNGAPHRYKPTTTYPKEYTKLRCQDCWHEKPMPTANAKPHDKP